MNLQLNCLSLSLSWSISKSTSRLRFRFWMIWTWEEDSELQTINPRRVWNRLCVPCRWGLTQAGIRFNSTWVISQEEHMEQITLKRSGWVCMQTADSGEFTSLTDCTRKMKYLLNTGSFQQKQMLKSKWLTFIRINKSSTQWNKIELKNWNRPLVLKTLTSAWRFNTRSNHEILVCVCDFSPMFRHSLLNWILHT